MSEIIEALLPDEQAALVVLWNKLVVDLRARLNVLEFEGFLEQPLVREILPQEFVATTQGGKWGGYLSVWLDADSGSGSWNQIVPDDDCQPWSITPEGVATMSGEQVSVYELADRFAAKLVTKR